MGPGIVTAYMWTAVILIVFFLIAVVSANMISYKPGGSDNSSRKVWFWVLAILTPVVAFIANFIVSQGIEVQSAASEYTLHAAIAAIVALVVFIVVGLALSKTCRNTKLSSWFN